MGYDLVGNKTIRENAVRKSNIIVMYAILINVTMVLVEAQEKLPFRTAEKD